MSERKIPADIGLYIDALLVIENDGDAKELIENPEFFEDLEVQEMPEENEDGI